MKKQLIILTAIILWLTSSYLTSKGLNWLIGHTGDNVITAQDRIGCFVGAYLMLGIITLVTTANHLDKRRI